MNELSSLFINAENNKEIRLKNSVYYVRPENSFNKKGLFFSNTAKYNENPEGQRFCAIFLENKENIVIDGNGATIMLCGIMTPFIFRNCKNITLKNITIDHVRPTMSEMTIVNSRKGFATVRINNEFRYRIDGDSIIWQGDDDESGKPYWEIPYKGNKVLTNAFNPETRIIDDMICGEGDYGHGFPDIISIKEIDKGLLELTFRDKNRHIPEGIISQTRCIRRIQTGGGIDECENITLENIRIKSMNCFGILAQNSKNICYNNIDATPAETRTVVSDADFFHFSGCMGEVKVLNCVCRGAHDDVINIHGTHLKILETDNANKSVLVRYSHDESWGFNPYNPEDEIEFVCGNTLLPYHTTKVKSVAKLNPTDFRITVDELPDLTPADNDVIENITRTASLTVDGCDFSRIPSRAILTTTRKPIIIRNTSFSDMGSVALLVADDANFWFESGRTGSIVFQNNKISNLGARETASGCDVIRYEPVILDESSDKPVHGSITITDNSFYNCPADGYSVNLKSVGKAIIRNNIADKPINIRTDNIVNVEL